MRQKVIAVAVGGIALIAKSIHGPPVAGFTKLLLFLAVFGLVWWLIQPKTDTDK